MKPTLKNTFGAGLIALAFSIAISRPAAAQSCAVPPTCEALGYTKSTSDCSGMSILKCPFDQSKIFCVTAEEVPGPTGTCGTPAIGDILYSDMSCSSSAVKEKFAIGVIFDPSRRLAIALQEERKYWSTEYFDIPGLTNQTSDEAKSSYNGKSNTKTIVDYCKANSKSCPAAEYAYSYTTKGTKAGDWFLPSLGELNLIYTRKDTLNPVLTSLSGTALSSNYYWSSSDDITNYAWVQLFDDGNVYGHHKNNNNDNVRPVLAF